MREFEIGENQPSPEEELSVAEKFEFYFPGHKWDRVLNLCANSTFLGALDTIKCIANTNKIVNLCDKGLLVRIKDRPKPFNKTNVEARLEKPIYQLTHQISTNNLAKQLELSNEEEIGGISARIFGKPDTKQFTVLHAGLLCKGSPVGFIWYRHGTQELSREINISAPRGLIFAST